METQTHTTIPQDQENNNLLSNEHKLAQFGQHPDAEEIEDEEALDEASGDESYTEEDEEIGILDELNDPSDISEDDLDVFESDEWSNDSDDDEQLKKRTHPVDFTGNDLDVPGSDLDDDEEEVGSEDEENNSYSIGGDNHHDLEESK